MNSATDRIEYAHHSVPADQNAAFVITEVMRCWLASLDLETEIVARLGSRDGLTWF